MEKPSHARDIRRRFAVNGLRARDDDFAHRQPFSRITSEHLRCAERIDMHVFRDLACNRRRQPGENDVDLVKRSADRAVAQIALR